MITYLASFAGIMALAFIAGRRFGRAKQNRQNNVSPMTAVIFVGLGLTWFVAARLARTYADTDSFGTDAAGWLAHSGKWLILLAGMMFGHGWICAAKLIPPDRTRRIFYFTTVFGLVALIGWRTMPVYFLLGDGQRDTDGYLRESPTLEVTCGAVALLNYLEQFRQHPPLTEREVSRICGVTTEGTTTGTLVNTAHQFGLTNATAHVLTLAKLKATKLPVIVSISTLPSVYHATLLVKLDAKRASFIDPAYGKWNVSRSRFQEIWHGRTILLEPLR